MAAAVQEKLRIGARHYPDRRDPHRLPLVAPGEGQVSKRDLRVQATDATPHMDAADLPSLRLGRCSSMHSPVRPSRGALRTVDEELPHCGAGEDLRSRPAMHPTHPPTLAGSIPARLAVSSGRHAVAGQQHRWSVVERGYARPPTGARPSSALRRDLGAAVAVGPWQGPVHDEPPAAPRRGGREAEGGTGRGEAGPAAGQVVDLHALLDLHDQIEPEPGVGTTASGHGVSPSPSPRWCVGCPHDPVGPPNRAANPSYRRRRRPTPEPLLRIHSHTRSTGPRVGLRPTVPTHVFVGGGSLASWCRTTAAACPACCCSASLGAAPSTPSVWPVSGRQGAYAASSPVAERSAESAESAESLCAADSADCADIAEGASGCRR